MGREPRVGQQLREPVDRLGRQSLQHILEVREGIAPEPLATADEAIQHRRQSRSLAGSRGLPVRRAMRQLLGAR